MDNELKERLDHAAKWLTRLDDPDKRERTASHLGDQFVVATMIARSDAHEVGAGESAECKALDMLIVKHARVLLDAMGGTFAFDEDDPRRTEIGERPYPDEHWWWYLDEMLSGKREWPEGMGR